VLGFDYAIMVFVTSEGIVGVIFVKETSTKQSAWCLHMLDNKFSGFNDDRNDSIPRLGKDGSVGAYLNANDHHTFEVYFQLSRQHSKMVIDHGTPVPSKNLSSKLVGYWK